MDTTEPTRQPAKMGTKCSLSVWRCRYTEYASATVAAVIVTGILGAITAPLMARLFRVRDGIAKGVAIGTCSHAVGTTKALEMGELEGAMSGVSIAVSGLLTTAIVIVASCFL